MRVTVLTIGSRGDVQPFVALGSGLRRAGHVVTLATHAEFAVLAQEHGLEFRPIAGNPRELVDEEAGQAWLESGRNPLLFVRRLTKLTEGLIDGSLRSASEACRDAEAIVYAPLGFAAYHIGEALGIPTFPAYLQPYTRTRAFASAFLAHGADYGAPLNWLSWVVGEQLFWQPFRTQVNRWRREALGLAPLPLSSPWARLLTRRVPHLYGFSPSVVPRPSDWPPWIHVTGYWFLDRQPDWQPPPELDDFLAAGPPPVYVGFGSMRARDAERVTAIVLEGLKRAGCRGILLPGWGGLSRAALSDDVFVVDDVPHAWLFPRLAAVVHHGGAGTTAAGLRAGRPSVLVPFFADQFFWGGRVAALGVGPRSIPHQQLSPARLAAAIRTAVEDEGIRARAAALGRQIRSEDGVARAVEAFHQHLRERRPVAA